MERKHPAKYPSAVDSLETCQNIEKSTNPRKQIGVHTQQWLFYHFNGAIKGWNQLCGYNNQLNLIRKYSYGNLVKYKLVLDTNIMNK